MSRPIDLEAIAQDLRIAENIEREAGHIPSPAHPISHAHALMAEVVRLVTLIAEHHKRADDVAFDMDARDQCRLCVRMEPRVSDAAKRRWR